MADSRLSHLISQLHKVHFALAVLLCNHSIQQACAQES